MKVLIFLLFVLAACSPHHDSGSSPEEGGTGVDDMNPGLGVVDDNCVPDGMPIITFNEISESLFETSCTFCHSEGSGLMNLEDYSTIKKNIAQIQDSIEKGRMPRGGSLTNEQKNKLAAWVSLGTPETESDIAFCDE